jgi:hypothetical protein
VHIYPQPVWLAAFVVVSIAVTNAAVCGYAEANIEGREASPFTHSSDVYKSPLELAGTIFTLTT